MIVMYYKLLLMLKGHLSKTLDYYFLIVTKMDFQKSSIVSALTVNSRTRGRWQHRQEY